jgi:prepilin-type N-terminal cleavage/methylation domain-containing protein
MMRATRPDDFRQASTPARAFTLVELLVVLLIILLVSAAALPTVLSGLKQRQVIEAARTFQAAVAGARDAAIANNAPRGIRLLPDEVLTQPPVGTYTTTGGVTTYTGGATTWACNRFVPIEPAPDYREGRAVLYQGWNNDAAYSSYYSTASGGYGPNVLCVLQSFTDSPTVGGGPVELTSWAWNLRVGDKIQFQSESSITQSTGGGHVYTVVGPVATQNAEGYINYGNSGPPTPDNISVIAPPEFLLLVNGVDDDADGFVDYGFDGVDNNNNGLIDIYDPTELVVEAEKWLGAQVQQSLRGAILPYVAKRRPIVARGARETLLPANVVIDLTTWNRTDGLAPERSRLPVDGLARYIDVLIAPGGQVIQSTSYSSPSSYISPYLHFWLTDREGVVAPITTAGPRIRLPMPAGTPGYTNYAYLEGERMLVTLFARTGNMTINTVQSFNDPITGSPNINAPFYAAQLGVKEAP